jgi:hypothetical protein
VSLRPAGPSPVQTRGMYVFTPKAAFLLESAESFCYIWIC